MTPYQEFYKNEVAPALMQRFNYSSVMQIPKLEKISVNMGVGASIQNPKLLDNAVAELSLITGQRAAITHAKKSVAAFKIRAGMPIGCKVTLRRDRMYEFMNRLVNVALPRIRDFRGVPVRSFDGYGNYSLGLEEQVIFPEIEYDKVSEIRGMNVNIVTSAETDEEAREFLRLMGMPFRQEG
ncbi:50S ribosomal protein L5 [Candidatus Poribacteria bacterium]|nr:50S ribosomal protein L5 [Candidatus Poribacteria bacterium]